MPLYYKFYLALNQHILFLKMLSYSLTQPWEVSWVKPRERGYEDLPQVTQLVRGLTCYPSHPFSLAGFHAQRIPRPELRRGFLF